MIYKQYFLISKSKLVDQKKSHPHSWKNCILMYSIENNINRNYVVLKTQIWITIFENYLRFFYECCFFFTLRIIIAIIVIIFLLFRILFFCLSFFQVPNKLFLSCFRSHSRHSFPLIALTNLTNTDFHLAFRVSLSFSYIMNQKK